VRKHPPGWKKRQEQKRGHSFPMTAPGVVVRFGDDAQQAFEGLLERMEKSPENFVDWETDLDR